MKNFDPNAAATKDSGIFGLPFSFEESELVLLPVPWDATTSYGGGACRGPAAIFKASKQIDLFDKELGNFFESGIFMLKISSEIQKMNEVAYVAARKIIENELSSDSTLFSTVNDLSLKLNKYVYEETRELLNQGKKVGLIGGDHSVPFGSIQAHLEKYPNMSVLHIDAHADLRNAFEGFEYSHASIMYNAMTKTNLKKLVQVGVRDFCEEEWHFIKNNRDKIITFFDAETSEKKLSGHTWSMLCDEILHELGEEVYISFDIDGLDPRFCPHTGTPVPGGLEYHEVLYLFKKLIRSGRRVIGFDLNEVSLGSTQDASSHVLEPAQEWDANVGARLLYKLCGLILRDTHNKIT